METELPAGGLLSLEPLEGRLRLWEPGRGHLLPTARPSSLSCPRYQLPLLAQVWFPGLGISCSEVHHACLFVPSQSSAAFSQMLDCQDLCLAQTGTLSP